MRGRGIETSFCYKTLQRVLFYTYLGQHPEREGTLTSADRALIIQRFRFDLNNQYQVIELDAKLTETAGQLVGQYPLRAYDAVQLASVLKIQPVFSTEQSISLVFLTSDDRLSTIAQALGLLTDNPNHHP